MTVVKTAEKKTPMVHIGTFEYLLDPHIYHCQP